MIAKLYCLLIDKTIPSAKSDHTAIIFQILICAFPDSHMCLIKRSIVS